jgi:hypothetical protein
MLLVGGSGAGAEIETPKGRKYSFIKRPKGRFMIPAMII